MTDDWLNLQFRQLFIDRITSLFIFLDVTDTTGIEVESQICADSLDRSMYLYNVARYIYCLKAMINPTITNDEIDEIDQFARNTRSRNNATNINYRSR